VINVGRARVRPSVTRRLVSCTNEQWTLQTISKPSLLPPTSTNEPARAGYLANRVIQLKSNRDSPGQPSGGTIHHSRQSETAARITRPATSAPFVLMGRSFEIVDGRAFVPANNEQLPALCHIKPGAFFNLIRGLFGHSPTGSEMPSVIVRFRHRAPQRQAIACPGRISVPRQKATFVSALALKKWLSQKENPSPRRCLRLRTR
jgi:hypothetical protein